MAEIEYCYFDGWLDKALEQAAQFVKKNDEYAVEAVVANHTDEAGWTVMVVYRNLLKERS